MTDTDKTEKWVIVNCEYPHHIAMPLSIFTKIAAYVEVVTATNDYSTGETIYDLHTKPLTLGLLPLGTMEAIIVKDRITQSGAKGNTVGEE